jgi:hypothetical protein
MPITDLYLKITRNYQRLYCIYFFSLDRVYKSVRIFGHFTHIMTEMPAMLSKKYPVNLKSHKK